MDNKKIEKILESVDLPDKISSTHKNQLRRELLNSKHFSRREKWVKFKPFERIAGGLVAIIILFILLTPKDKETINIPELLSLSKNHYAGFFVPGEQSSFNNNLKIFGRNTDPLNMRINQVIDFGNKKYRLIAFDNSGKSKLDEYIDDGQNVYRTKYPKLFAKNTKSGFKGINSNVTVTIRFDSTDFKDSLFLNYRDSIKDSIIIKRHFGSHQVNDEAFIVYQQSDFASAELGPKMKPVYFPVNKEVDLYELFKSNPLDILEDLSKSDSLVFRDNELIDSLGLECKVIENAVSLSRFALETIAVELGKIDSAECTGDNKIVFAQVSDSISKELKLMLKNSRMDDLYKKIERVKINPENGEICGIKYIIAKSGQEINLSEITFTNQKKNIKSDQAFEVTEDFETLSNPSAKIIKSHK